MIKNYLNKIFKPKQHKSHNFIDLIGMNQKSITNVGIEAYRSNVIVYRCVNLIAQTASHVSFLVLSDDGGNKKILHDHPINRLLRKPNPEQSGSEFFCQLIANTLLFGNGYIFSNFANFQEMYLLHPRAIEIVSDKNIAVAYKYNSASGEKIYRIDPVNRTSKVLHLKNYHPTSTHYGLSCLEAASMSIECHNQATKWNNSLFRNGARPTGALVFTEGSGYLTDEQFERLQEQLYDKFTGSEHSGKPLLLEGGLDWKEMSVNPKDMDFIESKNAASREIALAFGIPSQLIGIRGDNTYSNMQNARLGLWEETLIPLLERIANTLSNWFSYWCQDEIIIEPNKDSISALTEIQENRWAKIANASFMTVNEKRALMHLPAIEGGDSLSL